MRFLFIFPAVFHDKGEVTIGTAIPLGLAYLAAVLQKAGHEIRIIDFQDPKENVSICREALEEFKPQVIGFSFMLINALQAYEMIRNIKKLQPEIKILVGGPHPTSSGKIIFQECPDVDIVVRGEAETTILNLANALLGRCDISSIKGISFRSPGTGEIISNSDIDWVEDLNNIPYPARELFPVNSYMPLAGTFKTLPQIPLMTIRGCPYQCIFCNKQTWGSKFTMLAAKKVVEEISEVKERFGCRDIAFYDDSWTLDRRRAHAICDELIKKRLNVSWKCSTRADLVDQELLERMKEAGCYSVAIGVESGSDRILKLIQKGITKDKVKRAIFLCKKVGIETRTYFMINFPTETYEEIDQTISFAIELDPDYAAFNIVYPYRGTKLRQMVLDNPGIKVFYNKLDAMGSNLTNEVYYEQEHLSAEEVSRAYRMAYHKFYFRIRYIIKRLRQTQNLDQLRSYCLALRRIISVRGS